MVEHHLWFWWWAHLLNNSIEKQNQLKTHENIPNFTRLFWARKYKNFQLHPKQTILSYILFMKSSDLDFCWNRSSRTWFARAIWRAGNRSKMSPGMSCSNGADHVRALHNITTQIQQSRTPSIVYKLNQWQKISRNSLEARMLISIRVLFQKPVSVRCMQI